MANDWDQWNRPQQVPQQRGPGSTSRASWGHQGSAAQRPPSTPPQWQQPDRDDPGSYPRPRYESRPQQPPPRAAYQQPRFDPQDRYQPPPQRPQFSAQPQYQAPHQPPYRPQSAPPPRQKHTGRNIALGALGSFVLIIVIAIAASSGRSTTAGTSAAQAVAAQSAPEAPASTAPSGTTSQMQALAAAQDYLSDGQGFSRQGLIDQLDSSYGDSFSTADATWAVDHSGASWDDQAVVCAKGYMSDGQGFSREGLIEQMTSSYGSKFSQAQAEYAANKVGL